MIKGITRSGDCAVKRGGIHIAYNLIPFSWTPFFSTQSVQRFEQL
jgi:hypothetical protein